MSHLVCASHLHCWNLSVLVVWVTIVNFGQLVNCFIQYLWMQILPVDCHCIHLWIFFLSDLYAYIRTCSISEICLSFSDSVTGSPLHAHTGYYSYQGSPSMERKARHSQPNIYVDTPMGSPWRKRLSSTLKTAFGSPHFHRKKIERKFLSEACYIRYIQ